ncbi:MAG: response regulator [Candidatus Omnitrophica bacterium]|nr:response regulator [Candidatus Omnitrophota bacterium]
MKFLINESNEDIRRLYLAIFSPSDAEITFAETAEDARFLADLLRFDLVMIDVDFPDMEGLFIAREMIEERPDRPLLLISSVPLKQSDLGGGAAHSNIAFIMKPFNIHKLRGLIEDLAASKDPHASRALDHRIPALVH